MSDATGSLHAPVYRTTTFRFDSVETMSDVAGGLRDSPFYTRYGGNPTITRTEAKLAELESAASGLLFGAGMAAISAVLFAHGTGGVICLGEVYGGTHELLTRLLPTLEYTTHSVAQNDWIDLEEKLSAGMGLVYFETPTNPSLQIVDIARVTEIAHRHGALVAVDNTFATPINQRPLELGADIVIHSATKYLGGHSDLTAGFVATSIDLAAPIRAWRKNLGQMLSPDTAWLLSRSVATLPLRIARQNATALNLAQLLAQHPAVSHVHYPGLQTHPDHSLARRQMTGFGGVLTIVLKGTAPQVYKAMEQLRLFALAPSLGGVESLVSFPAHTSHRDMSPTVRLAQGIPDTMVRLSIGLEDEEDLRIDLWRALASITAT